MIDRKVVGGSLIVAGTAIGAGMLALPLATADGGFFPACFIYLLCWLFSTATGILFVEIINWMPQDSNIITMARRLLGKPGKVAAWILYIFLFYSLTVAYVSGGGNFVSSVLGDQMPKALGIILFTAVFGGVVYFGTKWVDRINSVLMLGLIVTFVAFVIMGAFEVDPTRLLPQKWGAAFLALP
ncbi:MAG: aromatic amino acid transport family protein, partial [Simkaniaceae bacterium]|nr:aromatic amino acid transport family protein [Simkaniaceae bacterium]